MKIAHITILLVSIFTCQSYASEEHVKHPKQMKWRFDGMLGKFDRQSIQRGFQVYKEVCSACHGLNQLYYRNLSEVGFSIDEVKTIASEYKVADTDENGEPIERPALISDRIVGPYANEKASRAANNGAYPPDLSLIIKAREDGANYVHSLLTGYDEPLPAGLETPEGQYYNPYFASVFIAMTPPLKDGIVSYSDGTAANVYQMARDVVNFLQWAAEPEMEKRKRMGLKVLMYTSILTVLMYLAKCRIWAKLK